MAKAPPLFKKDFQTDTWQRLRARVEHEIEVLRGQLESDSDPIPTARLRARLRQLRELLAWETMPAQARRTGDRLTATDLSGAPEDPASQGDGNDDE